MLLAAERIYNLIKLVHSIEALSVIKITGTSLRIRKGPSVDEDSWHVFRVSKMMKINFPVIHDTNDAHGL